MFKYPLFFLSLLLTPLPGITESNDAGPPQAYNRDEVTIELARNGHLDGPSGKAIGGCGWGPLVETVTISGAGDVLRDIRIDRDGCDNEITHSELDATQFIRLLQSIYDARFFELIGPYEHRSGPYYSDELKMVIGTAKQYVSEDVRYRLSVTIGTYVKVVDFRFHAGVPLMNDIGWNIRCYGGDELACSVIESIDEPDEDG